MKRNLPLITKLLPLAVLALVFLVSLPIALAASGAWNIDSDGLWNQNSNWNPGPFPNGSTETASFGSAISAARVVTIDGVDIVISQVTFDNGNSYTIAGANGGSLAIDTTSSGVNGLISVTNTSGSGAHTIALPVVLSRNLTVDVTTGTTLTISGSLNQVGSNRSVTKIGDGTLILTAFNSYAGGTTVSTGTLAIGHNAALGSGSLTLSAGTTVQADGGDRIIANQLRLNSGGSNTTFNNVLSFTSPVDITGGSTHNITVAGITNIAGVTSGCGGRNLSKYGAGTLNLRLNGGSNCNNGFLRHRNESTGPFNIYATGVVTSGRLLLNATDPAAASILAVGDDFVVATGIVTPGVGTWNVNGEISLQSATTVDIDLNGASAGQYDRMTYTFNPSGSDVNLNDAALQVDLGFTPAPGGTFTIISRAGGTGLIYGNFRDLPQGSVFTANGVQLLINYLPIISPTEVILTRVDISSTLGIAATGGSGQSTNIDTDFGLPLQATVTDQNGDPVPNALVTFSAPASGASAAFPAGNQRLTDANGVVTVTVRANSVPGSYNVTANLSPEQLTPASFSLTNTAPVLSIDDPSALESAGIMTFTVTLSEPTTLDVTAAYSTTAGTALDGVDYVGASGHLTITAGLTETIIPVSVISNSVVEGSRTFTMTLSNPSHAVIGKDQGIGTILDDDVAPPEWKYYLPLIAKN